MSINAYVAHARISAREDLRYFWSDAVPATVSTFGHIGVTLLFWHAAGGSFGPVGLPWAALVWYIIVTQVITSQAGDAVKVVNRHVQDGKIATYLGRPIYYPLMFLSTYLGSALMYIGAILLFVIPCGMLLAGTAALSAPGVILGTIAAVLALVIDFLISLCIGLLALWIENSRPFSWIYSKILFLFGGLLFPLDLLPSWLGGVAKLLPTAFILYYPAKIVADFSWRTAATAFAGQIGYIILFGALCALIYARGVRKVSVHGG